jgi:hypothetical protein
LVIMVSSAVSSTWSIPYKSFSPPTIDSAVQCIS